MLLEIAKPVALLLCMLSLWCVFYTAFLVPANDLEHRIWDSLILLSLASGICVTSGMIFRGPDESGAGSLMRTLPIQMFCWAVGLMAAWFLASWYLETYCIFFKDVRRL
jgi:hypothetical protein